MKPRYPNVEVELSGHDGNAFMIMGRVSKAMKKANVPQTEIDQFMKECKSGDYDNLLQTCMKWVEVS